MNLNRLHHVQKNYETADPVVAIPPRAKLSLSQKNFRFLRVYSFSISMILCYVSVLAIIFPLGQKFKQKLKKQLDIWAGNKIKRAILKKQGLFIKAGQFSHLFRAILSEDFLNPLEDLQDRVTAQPFSLVETQLIKAFGANYRDFFIELEETALAAASMGQVHRGRILLENNESAEIVVKVLYPYIEELIRLDLRSLRFIFGLVRVFFPHFQAEQVHEQISVIIFKEIDLNNERLNLLRMKQNFHNDAYLIVPEVYGDYCSEFILTMEYIDGIKITDLTALNEAEISGDDLAELLIWAFAKQIFQFRFFHADPHPGNMLILPGPKLVLLDFGACEILPEYSRDAFRKIIRGAMGRDYYKVIEGLEELGAVPRAVDLQILETAVAYAVDKMIKIERERRTWNEMSVEELTGMEDLRYLKQLNIGLNDIMQNFNVPQGWIALERVLGHVMAIIMQIAPQKTLGQLAKPHLSKLILDDYQGFKNLVNEQSRAFAYNLIELPYSLNKAVNQIYRGRTEIRVQKMDLYVNGIINSQRQIVWAMFTIFFGSLSLVGFIQELDFLFVNGAMLSIFSLLGTLRAALPGKWKRS